MINYHKNDLLDDCLTRYYATFSLTLDTCDYVPEKFNKKIYNYIFKNMKKTFKKINKDDNKYQKEELRQQKKKMKVARKLQKYKERELKALAKAQKREGKVGSDDCTNSA